MHRTKKHHFSPDYHVEIAFGSQVRGTRGGGGGVAFFCASATPPLAWNQWGGNYDFVERWMTESTIYWFYFITILHLMVIYLCCGPISVVCPTSNCQSTVSLHINGNPYCINVNRRGERVLLAGFGVNCIL